MSSHKISRIFFLIRRHPNKSCKTLHCTNISYRAPRTVPQPVDAQLGLGDDDPARRSYSAPHPASRAGINMDALPPGSPDSSEARSNSNSSLENLSEAGGVNRAVESPVDSLEGSFKGEEDTGLPAEAVDPIELMSGTASKTLSGAPMAPRPTSGGQGSRQLSDLAGSRPGSGVGSRAGSAMSGRPGSDRHPVLPPISPHARAMPEF